MEKSADRHKWGVLGNRHVHQDKTGEEHRRDDHANPDAVLAPHSVLTEHLIDEPGQPTRQALDSVLDHFRTRLLAVTGHNG